MKKSEFYQVIGALFCAGEKDIALAIAKKELDAYADIKGILISAFHAIRHKDMRNLGGVSRNFILKQKQSIKEPFLIQVLDEIFLAKQNNDTSYLNKKKILKALKFLNSFFGRYFKKLYK